MAPASTCMEEEDKGKHGYKKSKEGHELLGSPTFKELDNGRFKCVETGHEMPPKEMESYSHSKRCRLGLIESALSQKKPPLSMFKQDPISKSKLICKLTGDTINKSEEHIWKHINGSKFLTKLEKKESGQLSPKKKEVDKDEQKTHKGSKLSTNGVKKKKKNRVDRDILNEKKPIDEDTDSEEPDFWSPPLGSRWDFDDGGDRWASGTDSEQESDDGDGIEEADENGVELEETEKLTTGTKRLSIEVGPSSFASRKKKNKISSAGDLPSN